ncbi:thiamine diphosphokinase [Staphylococcus arlettae]|uniref:thiamine diphosphokinase n=1 Tax=Staphylococcus arlettae TaxID=29378 RepID=UPI000D1B92AC|nr:thiamine diphosphokinase [Staphylococcus arlettae]PTH29156.1 thiamine diphosphokinase [Staphylococcus arlettae]PTH47179.1 thiamine diphosphokinase [Staphylococcus arlettae]PTH53570.1 thiamine diphosphokinase [Staphylococcus arlettae]PTH64909.1 thiamine diphosphokinase [Staphylococcus arlettae]
MKAKILCGNRNLPAQLLETANDDHWIGVDRGALILIQHDITPKLAVGDFDSVTDKERMLLVETLNINPVEAEKDDTDLALAIAEAIDAGYDDIEIYGATGARLDHFMGALQILEKPEYHQGNVNLCIIDAQNEIQYLPQGQHIVSRDESYQYVSFIPVIYPVTITLQHFKYELFNQTLALGSTLTVSNELNEERGKVIIDNGSLLMIKSKDA